MAGTLVVAMQASIAGDVMTTDANIQPVSITLTNGVGGNPGYVTFTTSETDVDFGALTGKRYVQLWNVGTANKIQIGPKSGGVMVQDQEIAPGEFAWICLASGVTLRGRSDTGTAYGVFRGYN